MWFYTLCSALWDAGYAVPPYLARPPVSQVCGKSVVPQHQWLECYRTTLEHRSREQQSDRRGCGVLEWETGVKIHLES